jgi:diguanylate cyclase (GGDEF)-like protein/PAS domain S-box-containing protein
MGSSDDGFRVLVERSDHMLGRHHPNGQYFYVSPGCERLLGFQPEDLLGTDPYALLHPDDVSATAEVHRSVATTDEPLRVAARLRRKDGSYLWCHSTARAVRDPATGSLVEIHTSTRDAADWREGQITREREAAARAALAENEALLRVAKAVAQEDSPDQVFELVTREAGLLLAANSAFICRFEGEALEVMGTWGDNAPPIGVRFPLEGDRPIARVYRTGAPTRSLPDDTSDTGHPADLVAPIFASGRLWGVVVTSRRSALHDFDPGEEQRLTRFTELVALAIAGSSARAELTLRATTDSLTGLANHREFHGRLDAEMVRARRHGHSLSVAILDVDRFKHINDRLGHQAGDLVLLEIARRLAAVARTGDLLGRVGGEEFAWLLPETDLGAASAAARRACHAIRDVTFRDAGTVTVSIGVSTAGDGDDERSLYRRADRALYRAKGEGRDRVVTAADDDRPRTAGVS